MIIKYIDKTNKFNEIFNTKTGFYMRTGILDENGKDTGVDPFMRNFAQLLDIGIMGHCVHGETGLCIKSGVQCYQNGLGIKDPNMTPEQFESIARQCEGRCFQFALGGRGDVNKHEQFEEILKICRKYNIVPNYTTSGLELTDKEVELTKQYCGAVATSMYFADYTYEAIDKFLKAGVRTNIHFVLGNNTIDRAIDMLKNNKFPKGINAIIFLLHKNIGLGKIDNVLKFDDPRVKEFYELIDNNRFEYKIGFDSCNIPGLMNFTKNINPMSWDTCEGGRFSAYISSTMKIMPCSFDNQDEKWAVDLNKYTVKEAWDSSLFEDFRNSFRNSCPSCKNRNDCLGGCPITREIVLCNRKEKNLK